MVVSKLASSSTGLLRTDSIGSEILNFKELLVWYSYLTYPPKGIRRIVILRVNQTETNETKAAKKTAAMDYMYHISATGPVYEWN